MHLSIQYNIIIRIYASPSVRSYIIYHKHVTIVHGLFFPFRRCFSTDLTQQNIIIHPGYSFFPFFFFFFLTMIYLFYLRFYIIHDAYTCVAMTKPDRPKDGACGLGYHGTGYIRAATTVSPSPFQPPSCVNNDVHRRSQVGGKYIPNKYYVTWKSRGKRLTI